MITDIKTCENDGCKNKPERILRLTSSHGSLQNPLRFRNRTPARIVVCSKCAEKLCSSESQLEWEQESEFKGELAAEGTI